MPLAQTAGLYLTEVLRGGIYNRGLNECQQNSGETTANNCRKNEVSKTC